MLTILKEAYNTFLSKSVLARCVNSNLDCKAIFFPSQSNEAFLPYWNTAEGTSWKLQFLICIQARDGKHIWQKSYTELVKYFKCLLNWKWVVSKIFWDLFWPRSKTVEQVTEFQWQSRWNVDWMCTQAYHVILQHTYHIQSCIRASERFWSQIWHKGEIGGKKNLILKMKNAKIYTGRNSVHRLGKGLARQHLYMKRYGDFDG